ncbi:MAG: M56 family metallopeptidase [Clostridia bacterium]|nr:M56 family metallopeptidase [Clostridia bacterium]
MYGLFLELGYLFMQLVNISITAGWLVLAVVLLRLLFRKAPKWVYCLLWGIVALRLLLSFSLESPMSMVPSKETLPVTNIYSPDPGVSDNPHYHQVDSGVEVFDAVVSPIVNDVNPTAMRSNFSIFACVWLAGMAVMLTYTVVSYLRLHRRTREGVEWERGVWLCDRIDTPFILGIVKPRIFLPTTMGAEDKMYVLAHEKAHLRRGDHLWKPLGFALLTVYWYNPILWVAYILLCRDIELACDEKVIRQLGEESKAAYSDALINCSVPRHLVAACPLAFGEVGVKNRIKSVLNYKKPAFWVVVVAVIACIVLAVGFLTDPVERESWTSSRNGLFVHTISAECENVQYALLDASAEPKDQYIQVEWENNTQNVLCFGQEYTLYKDDEPYPMGDRVWELLLYTILPRGNYIERYNLPGLPEGEYRLEKSFYLEDAPDTQYRAFIDFSVEPTYSFVNNTFTMEGLVYDAAGYEIPFDVNDSDARIFSVTQHKLLSVAENGGQWLTLGELLPVVLERKNFDDLFADTNWQGGLLAP